MKTLLLISIIAVIGISLTTIVFIYQYQQNCRVEGGSLVEPLTCDKTNYELIMDLFQKKYAPQRGSVIDRTDGAIFEMISIDPQANSMTLLIKENRNGPYSAEILCKYKSGKTERVTENILNYLENGGCFRADSSFEFAPETTVPSGGRIYLDCNKKDSLPDMKCFVKSYQNCSPAKIQQTRYTVEGDYAMTIASVQENGTECMIHVIYESNDRFGFSGTRESTCHNISAENQFSWIIDQCEEDYSFEFYVNEK